MAEIQAEQRDPVSGTMEEIPVIDYEGSPYQSSFWQGQGRDYEDAVERLALGRMMPSQGPRLAEIGAGFGRLADLYLGYKQVVLFDYSRSLLREAVERWGHDPRFVFVAGNIYQLPLASGVLDTLVMVRVMHHLADVGAALTQLRRTMHSQSLTVIEYANKRNLKALMRWLAQRQDWSPVQRDPIEFVELNFDFHPDWMEEQFRLAGLTIVRQYAVSHFRLPVLKRTLSAERLAQIDSRLFALGGRYPLAPSVFLSAEIQERQRPAKTGYDDTDVAAIFCCPQCRTEGLTSIDAGRVACPGCGRHYARQGQVWDFKEPIA